MLDGSLLEILSHVFDYLDLDQLNKCKYVCKIWKKEAEFKISRRKHFHIELKISIPQSLAVSIPVEELEEKLSQIKNKEKTLKRMVIHGGLLSFGLYPRIVNMFGKFLSELTVDYDISEKGTFNAYKVEEQLHELLSEWCVNLKELCVTVRWDNSRIAVNAIPLDLDLTFQPLLLEKLCVKIVQLHSNDVTESFYNFFARIAWASPKLKTLDMTVILVNKLHTHETLHLLSTMLENQNENLHKLEELFISERLNYGALEKLSNFNFKNLTSIGFSKLAVSEPVMEIIFLRLLKNNAATLKCLKFEQVTTIPPKYQNKYLILMVLNILPNLEYLSIGHFSWNMDTILRTWIEEGKNFKTYGKLKKLHVSTLQSGASDDSICQLKTLKVITLRFPNLRSLSLDISSDYARDIKIQDAVDVLSNLSHLKDLIITDRGGIKSLHNVCQGLALLHKFSNLLSFTLSNPIEKNSELNWVNLNELQLKKALLEMKPMQLVWIINIYLSEPQRQDMMEFARSKKINLKITSDLQEPQRYFENGPAWGPKGVYRSLYSPQTTG